MTGKHRLASGSIALIMVVAVGAAHQAISAGSDDREGIIPRPTRPAGLRVPPHGLTFEERRQWIKEENERRRQEREELRRWHEQKRLEQQRRLVDHIRSQKHATKEEILQMLQEMPRGFISCGTGIRWFGFLEYAPHSPETVAALREIFAESKNSWVRKQVLQAMSLQTDSALRDFWRRLFQDRKLPREWLGPATRGWFNTGTPMERHFLLRRLGESKRLLRLVRQQGDLPPQEARKVSEPWLRAREVDLALLQVLMVRPYPPARSALLALYRDSEAGELRQFAHRALLALEGLEKEDLLE